MATVNFKGNPINTIGQLPQVGGIAPEFKLVKGDLSEVHLADFKGSRLVLNVFPSIDTPTCAASVRAFNQKANELNNTKVLCISKDLPFAQNRFCGAEGLSNVITLSDFATGDFGKTYGLELLDLPFKGLLSRAVIVLDENHKVLYTELVSEIANEPDYQKALAIL